MSSEPQLHPYAGNISNAPLPLFYIIIICIQYKIKYGSVIYPISGNLISFFLAQFHISSIANIYFASFYYLSTFRSSRNLCCGRISSERPPNFENISNTTFQAQHFYGTSWSSLYLLLSFTLDFTFSKLFLKSSSYSSTNLIFFGMISLYIFSSLTLFDLNVSFLFSLFYSQNHQHPLTHSLLHSPQTIFLH